MELNQLHIAFGAPSYAAIAKASVRPKLTKAGINEALSGKRLPSVDSLLEFVRVVSSSLPPGPDISAPPARRELVDAWRTRWQEVKFAQRQAQAPWRRLRDTVRETLDEAIRDAEAIRAAAYEEAERIVSEARRTADELRKTVSDEGRDTTEATVAEDEWLPVSDEGRDTAEATVAEDEWTWDATALADALKANLRRSAPEPPVSDDGAPFWFAVAKPSPVFSVQGGAEPIAKLVPGVWYLAVGRLGPGLIAQTEDGRQGVLLDLVGIQRGY
jgi:vacuolar-type H+-ATPase subunit H